MTIGCAKKHFFSSINQIHGKKFDSSISFSNSPFGFLNYISLFIDNALDQHKTSVPPSFSSLDPPLS